MVLKSLEIPRVGCLFQGIKTGFLARGLCVEALPPGRAEGGPTILSSPLSVEMAYTFLPLRVLSKVWLKESYLFWAI